MRTVFEVEIYVVPLSVVESQNNNNVVTSKMVNNAGKD